LYKTRSSLFSATALTLGFGAVFLSGCQGHAEKQNQQNSPSQNSARTAGSSQPPAEQSGQSAVESSDATAGGGAPPAAEKGAPPATENGVLPAEGKKFSTSTAEEPSKNPADSHAAATNPADLNGTGKTSSTGSAPDSSSNGTSGLAGSNLSSAGGEMPVITISDKAAAHLDLKAEVIKERELNLPLFLTGHIETIIGGEVDVSTRVAGRLTQILVKPGQRVAKGDLLAIIESREVAELEG
jgi:biotin carboxyl carrier protein